MTVGLHPHKYNIKKRQITVLY